ncbi:unnamed protein product, partial [marine sediment metagenome]
YCSGGTLLLCGNGGSASDAEHWAGELLKGFRRNRPLTGQWLERLGPELGTKLQGALPAIPLTGFPALSSAYGNDVDSDYVFAQLVFGLGRAGDALVGISTSGGAGNVVLAMKVAAALGMRTVALTGRSGGEMAPLAEVSIRVPADETDRVQELHLPVYHTLSLMLEEEFFA